MPCTEQSLEDTLGTQEAYVLLEEREKMCMSANKITFSALKRLQQAKW